MSVEAAQLIKEGLESLGALFVMGMAGYVILRSLFGDGRRFP